MSVVSKLKTVRDALTQVTENVFHYEAENKNGPYIVWMEDGEGDSLHLNDRKNEQVITGTVDLFTKDEYDQLIDDIQNALSGADISFILNSVQYEEETEFTHYEWRFEI